MEHEQWDQYATDYHENIISPFQEEVQNPLVDEIELRDTKDLVVADIGCGPGDFLPFLSQQFKHVHAIDFSQRMLATARQRHGERGNIDFWQADMRELSALNLHVDVAVAVNSVLQPSFEDVNKSLAMIYGSLNDDGLFLGIFPSMESVLYNFMLVYEREYAKWMDEKKALRETQRKVERKKYNFITCTYEDGDEKQKFYYEFELLHRLRQAGFKRIRFKKVRYPWGNATGAYEDFYGMPEMWDWYVTARK